MPEKEKTTDRSFGYIYETLTVAAIIVPLVLLCVLHMNYDNHAVYIICLLGASAVFGGCVFIDFTLCRKQLVKRILLGLTVLILSFISCLSVRMVCYNTADYEKKQPRYVTINSYIQTHSDSIWITSTIAQTDIKSYVTDSKTLLPCFYSFDYMQFSDVYKHKLALNNLTSLSSNSLLEDGVYLISTNENIIVRLEEYLSSETGKKVKATTIDALDNDVKVYSFAFS